MYSNLLKSVPRQPRSMINFMQSGIVSLCMASGQHLLIIFFSGSVLLPTSPGLYWNLRRNFSRRKALAKVCMLSLSPSHWLPGILIPLPKVPVIAIFTKFDDLVTQVWDGDKTEDENHMEASRVLQEKLRDPLYAPDSLFPPKGDMYLQGKLFLVCFFRKIKIMDITLIKQRCMKMMVIIKNK